MKIADREIDRGLRPYIVAEISGEHQRDWSKFTRLVDAAKEAGADAVKIQLFSPYDLAELRGGANKMCSDGPWKGKSLLELYQDTFTPWIWLPQIFEYTKQRRITCFSSVFSQGSVDALEKHNCPAYKISHKEFSKKELIKYASDTKKPLIISLPTMTQQDFPTANKFLDYVLAIKGLIENIDIENTCFLHCTSNYPCPPEKAQLKSIYNYYRADPQIPMGLSDHTQGVIAPVVATTYGAVIIEKHITLDYVDGGWDKTFSLDPTDFKTMVRYVNAAYDMQVPK